MKRKMIGVLLLAALGACAYPGREGLERQGESWKASFSPTPEAVSSCLVDHFETEKWTLGSLPIRVTMVNRRPEFIELISSNGGSYFWRMEIYKRETAGALAIVQARNSMIHPYLSNRYVVDKLKAAISTCSGESSPADDANTPKG